jgi:hypothetical protein
MALLSISELMQSMKENPDMFKGVFVQSLLQWLLLVFCVAVWCIFFGGFDTIDEWINGPMPTEKPALTRAEGLVKRLEKSTPATAGSSSSVKQPRRQSTSPARKRRN